MTTVTRRGGSVVGAAVGLYLGGRILGLVQLSVLAATGFVLVVGAWTWVRLHAGAVRAQRHQRERLQVGVEGRVDLVVEPDSPRATPTLSVTDAFDRGRRAARFLVGPMAPGEVARAAYRVPTDRRGRFELGPLRATVSDPFGLASRTRRVLGIEEVIVYPRVHEILPLPEGGGTELDRDMPRARGRLDPGGEFHTLREYSPGDDLRRVHWRSTARRDRMMVRQNEARRRAPVIVLLDVRPGAHDRASFERAVEACASIATALERVGRPWEAVLGTGVTLGTPGRRHLASVMDELAVVEPNGPDRFVAARSGRRTGALVAATGRMDAVDAGALRVLVRADGMVAVVATAAGTDLAGGRTSRAATLLVPFGPEQNLVDTWNEAVIRWQRSGSLSSSTSPAPA